jgi:hypothetical protein
MNISIIKSTSFLILIPAILFTITSSNKTNKPLSAGVTENPNTNYQVADSNKADFEPSFEKAHNTRIMKPYHQLEPELRHDVPLQLKPHSRLLLTDIEDRPFFDYFAWQTFIGLI